MISYERLVQIGLRGLNYPEYKEYCDREGILQIPAPEAIGSTAEELAQRAVQRAGRDHARMYLTLDIDVISPR